MFSEYASRFLAQSQSRLSNFVQPAEPDHPGRTPDRNRRGSRPIPSASRAFAPRQPFGNPYLSTASQLSGFPFASRLSAAPAHEAPLFHSALDEFREEDDEEEREREVADFYALQRSRRVFGASRLLEESTETDGEGESTAHNSREEEPVRQFPRRGQGIKSSWNGGREGKMRSAGGQERVDEEPEDVDYDNKGKRRADSDASEGSKGKMVDVGLESVMGDHDSDDPPDYLEDERDDDEPPAFQQFRQPPTRGQIRLADSKSYANDRDIEAGVDISRPPSVVSTIPATQMGGDDATPVSETALHDAFWGSLYLIGLASMFATFFLVFLHTSTPSSKLPLGDTIYTALRSSFHLLAVDTVVAIIVSLVWLALLRNFVKPLVYTILVGVPVILFSFWLYPLVSSYKGDDHGGSFQNRMMRWLSILPLIFAIAWTYTVYYARHSMAKAIGILEFSSRIVGDNPALVSLGFATVGAVIVWTWLWLIMFTRVFLGGHTVAKAFFVIDASTWALGAFFVLMYLWTLAIISGLQRVATAATVSQWYFHRNVTPAPSSREIVLAGLNYAATAQFGTISLSTLLALLIRLPVLLLPRRLMGIIAIFAYNFIPTPIAALINPLTLTYASIQSQPLSPSARALSQMSYLGVVSGPTTTLTPRSFSARNRPGGGGSETLLPYRLAKLLLHATRFIMALALGFGAWVSTARGLDLQMPNGKGMKGSAYAYVVGLVAGFIGWGVLGAVEGVLDGVVDGSLVCWGIEMGSGGRYCLEAGRLFGEGGRGYD